jgi:hypothetical protein
LSLFGVLFGVDYLKCKNHQLQVCWGWENVFLEQDNNAKFDGSMLHDTASSCVALAAFGPWGA